MNVFLGGTTNNSKWRNIMKIYLNDEDLTYFDPIVDDWNIEAQEKEIQERSNSDFCLYVITPKMKGVYSIFEVADDSNKRPDKTVFVYLETDGKNKFDERQLKSLKQVAKGVKENGGHVFDNLKSAAVWMGKIMRLMK